MKRILLTSTALVAFAGAAAAEVSFKGDAEIGFNDEVKNGFYWSMGLTVNASQELNGGLTAGFTLDVDLDDAASATTFTQGAITTSDFELYLKSDTAGMYFGDTKTATQQYWEGVRGMQSFFKKKGKLSEDAVMRAYATMGAATVAVSAAIQDANGGSVDTDIGAYQAVVKYDAGSFTVIGAYQAKDTDFGLADAAMGLTGMASFAGADITLSYAAMGDANSVGLGVKYPFGPVALAAGYVANKDAAGVSYDRYYVSGEYKQGAIWAKAYYDGGESAASTDMSIFGLHASYDMGNGLKLLAAVESDTKADVTAYYIAGEYDLGGGASLMMSYADDGVAATASEDVADWNDDFGDYNDGATVALSFKF